MLKRLIAITFIFCSASIAWMILGATLVARTADSDSRQREKLTAQWGSPQAQLAPQVNARVAIDTYNKDRRRIERGYEDVAVPLRSSRVLVKLDLEQRRDGLLWYNLYQVRFSAHTAFATTRTAVGSRCTSRFLRRTARMRTSSARSADGAWQTPPRSTKGTLSSICRPAKRLQSI